MLNKKGQSSVEFLAYAGFFLLVFSAATTMLLFGYLKDASIRKTAVADQIGNSFAESVNAALSAGSGFFGVFDCEQRLLGGEYSASFGKDGFVRVEWKEGGEGHSQLYPIRTKALEAISGEGVSASQASNVYLIEITPSKGYYSIENDEGTLKIAQRYENVGEWQGTGGGAGTGANIGVEQ
ncbi:hypothetical protein COV61_04935 [Candidatus Micrarchaeota archaeon CG11_big_fil_rev_8_21_14_0_20_47_5]|nr:MAG: hypothetical protein AUJ17_00355 [Candidatus Micrarchaeota archaeon CG1_02_47_40]PIN82786.1 MAG: hypothetical protein COV61_04935 [Candidatus Micrarchaeota archaeon CG11_big_fil_rev_8_21_14_0_20_47_5]